MQPDYSNYNEPYGNPGKFEGERMAVYYAYEASLDGCCDSFGDVNEYGAFFCAVEMDEPIGTVYFMENKQGFVSEISEHDYRQAEEDYDIWCEDNQNA